VNHLPLVPEKALDVSKKICGIHISVVHEWYDLFSSTTEWVEFSGRPMRKNLESRHGLDFALDHLNVLAGLLNVGDHTIEGLFDVPIAIADTGNAQSRNLPGIIIIYFCNRDVELVPNPSVKRFDYSTLAFETLIFGQTERQFANADIQASTS
jgi:hypothetical protein